MEPDSTFRRTTAGRAVSPPPGVGALASAFVLAALAALVLLPLAVQRRVDEVRSRVEEVSEPARTLVRRLQFDLASQSAALFLVSTGQAPEAMEAFREARRDEEARFPELAEHAERLGGEVLREFVRFRTLAEQWHARVGVNGAAPADLREAAERVREERALAEEVNRAAERLDQALARDARRVRDAVRRTERLALRVTVGLGVLALLAALTVAWLSWRVHQLARVATQRGEEAERALAERARAMEARTRLLRGVSHDVKNPLGAARGYAELLETGIKGELNADQARFVAGIRRSIDGALAILADLLDLARMDAGGLTVERVPVDLARLAAEAADDHRPAAVRAGHTLEHAAAEPVRVHTDPARVRQVLDNLLSNALKYTPSPGRVTVRVEHADGAGARPGKWAAVRVIDTGPGIPPDQRETVFDEFTRLHDGTGIQGHGLGLAISRRVARLLGGDLDVAGEPGEGATFTLWLPVRDAHASDGAAS